MTEPNDDTILACLADALEVAGIEGIAIDRLTPGVSLDVDLGVDSFQLMQVARHLEKAYAFKFSLADWAFEEEEREPPAYTVGSLLAFVKAQSAAINGS
jgi:acyl carrier protein